MRKAEELLEFDALRGLVRGYTTCEPGRRCVAALRPGRERSALETEFAQIREAREYLRAGSELGFGSLADPQPWLEHIAAPAAVLAPGELLDAASLLDTTAWLREAFRAEKINYPLLAARAVATNDFRALAAAIRRAVLPNGEISDDASPELKKIRTAKGRAREKLQKLLRDILRARTTQQEDQPAADYITIRNDRFVIPVRAAEKRHVPGVVHAASATGQTLFLEPLEAIEHNNRLVQLAEAEAAEIARILRELTERLQSERGPLHFAAETIAELDSTFARARFAREYDCCLPAFTENQRLRLDSARHPVLEANLRKHSRPIVPMTIALGGDETVMVISGPNTGGKTVALKTAGLAALAAQSGIPIAAQRAELPLFDRVLADIGDEQSIAADLSTFSAHVTNLRAMLETATADSLVLADEMGTGTAPEEGAALAVALLEEFRERRCLTLATTHHDRLKAWASTTPQVLNAAVEFDEARLRPTYRLMLGVPGGSSGIAIAQRLGLPPVVIERARAQLDPGTREAAGLIAYLHRSRDELEQMKRDAATQFEALEIERRALQSDWAERQRKRLADLEQQFAGVLKQYERQVKELLGEVKDRDLRAQMEKQASRKLTRMGAAAQQEWDAAVVQHLDAAQQDTGAELLAKDESVTPEKLVAGARVRVRGLAQAVVVRSTDGGRAEIQAGPLRMRVAVSEITAIVAEPESGKGKVEKEKRDSAAARHAPATSIPAAPRSEPGVRVHADASREPVPDEINVIGLTVEAATERVDKFLDNAALCGKLRVRIIHGHGTGALRRGLAAFLTEHLLVARFGAEAAERGGTAITIVELRGQ